MQLFLEKKNFKWKDELYMYAGNLPFSTYFSHLKYEYVENKMLSFYIKECFQGASCPSTIKTFN